MRQGTFGHYAASKVLDKVLDEIGDDRLSQKMGSHYSKVSTALKEISFGELPKIKSFLVRLVARYSREYLAERKEQEPQYKKAWDLFSNVMSSMLKENQRAAQDETVLEKEYYVKKSRAYEKSKTIGKA